MTRKAPFRRIEIVVRAAGWAIGFVASLCVTQAALAADVYALTSPASKDAVSATQTIAVQSGLLAPTVFTRQSFILAEHGETLGSFVVGRAFHPTGGAAVGYTCFVTYISHSGTVQQIVRTIGVGNWEAESCDDVKSVGLLSGSAGSTVRIGIIFDARSPNADVIEPVVLTLDDGKTLDIDLKASQQASTLGATDLKAMRKMDLSRVR